MVLNGDTEQRVLSVGELNRQARLAMERALPSCWVRGEVANFSRAGSGHWYFSLKDEQAAVRCAMFKARNQFVDWQPRDGDLIEVRAQPTLYEQRGDFQLLVEGMRRAGQGSLFEAFLKLKAKLEAEGLFASERKRPLPRFPRTIGVVTSLQAAALRDVLTTLKTRWPSLQVTLYPSPVQGSDAPSAIVEALRIASERRDCDVLLLVRGGGSMEDLSVFNDERVARAIATSSVPIITGVGHETDFSIADFVADLRAPTPTGAAQLATPSRIDLNQHVQHSRARLAQCHLRRLQSWGQRLDGLTRHLKHPRERILNQRQRLSNLIWRVSQLVNTSHHVARLRLAATLPSLSRYRETLVNHQRIAGVHTHRLDDAMRRSLAHHREQIRFLQTQLDILSPTHVLSRGYSIISNRMGHVIHSTDQVEVGEDVDILLGSGGLTANITGSKPPLD